MRQNLLKFTFAAVVLAVVYMNRGNGTIRNAAPGGRNQPVAFYTEDKKLLASVLEGSSAIASTFENAPSSSPEASVSKRISVPAPSEIKTISSNAEIFLISDLEKDDNVAASGPDRRWPLASLTKLMTAVVASEAIPSGAQVPITENTMAVEGEAGGFKPGEEFMVDDLIKSLFTVSSNRAAAALSEFYGEDKFYTRMNEKAASLGMSNTFYKESTGLSPLNQSSANDLKILMRYIYKNHQEFLAASQKKEAVIRDLASGRARTLRNINAFAGRNDFLGGKTGFISDSGQNLVSLFSRGGRPVIIVVLNAGDRFKETSSILSEFDTLYR